MPWMGLSICHAATDAWARAAASLEAQSKTDGGRMGVQEGSKGKACDAKAESGHKLRGRARSHSDVPHSHGLALLRRLHLALLLCWLYAAHPTGIRLLETGVRSTKMA